MTWHGAQRAKLGDAKRDDGVKFFAVRCLEGEKCGDPSDRMKLLPFYLHAANLAERALLIHWHVSCALKNFLRPPLVGIDCRLDGSGVDINEVRNNSVFAKGHARSLSAKVT